MSICVHYGNTLTPGRTTFVDSISLRVWHAGCNSKGMKHTFKTNNTDSSQAFDNAVKAVRAERARPENASAAYNESLSRVNKLIAELQHHVANHSAKQGNSPSNWGYVGDMNHYAELLEELLGRR